MDQLELQKQSASTTLRAHTIGSMVLSLPVIMISMFFLGMPHADWIMAGLTTPVIVIFGRRFFISAYKN